MRRRDFVKAGLTAAVLPAIGSGLLSGRAAALPTSGRVVVNVMLAGGADLRYLFMPDPATQQDYAAGFWRARSKLHGSYGTELSQYGELLRADYALCDIDGQSFAMHKAAGWLKQHYDAGRVAIVANVFGPLGRSHDVAQLTWHTGDTSVSQFDDDRDGWGGRLAHAIGDATVVNPVPQVSPFCYGPDPDNRNAKVFRAYRLRDALIQDSDPNADRDTLARALKSYYEGKQPEAAAAQWPYSVIFGHERRLRTLGRAVSQRLASVAPKRPPSLSGLYSGGGTALGNAAFGEQCADLYDCLLAADLLTMRAAYLELGSWDTHSNEASGMSGLLSDLLGTGKGLASLHTELERQHLADNVVFVLTSDFGRQLAGNSRQGTDHGTGNYSIVIGNAVRGGVYGEMFPSSEIQGSAGETAFERVGADIEGRTSFLQVLGAIADWVQPGAGNTVFPNYRMAMIEPEADLQRLFA